MGNKRIAGELLHIAKRVQADAGDVEAYFNISDFFEREDGERMIPTKDAAFLKTILSSVIIGQTHNMNKMLARELKKKERALSQRGYNIKG